MPLLNYTTQIDTGKTIGEIHKCLAAHKAIAILNEYDDTGSIVAVSFKIRLGENEVGFKLPSDWRPVLKLLERNSKVPRRLATKEQAIRVSWRIIKDWVEAQMAIVETEMVKLEQVFLPYAITKDGITLYERVIKGGLLLGDGKPL